MHTEVVDVMCILRYSNNVLKHVLSLIDFITYKIFNIHLPGY